MILTCKITVYGNGYKIYHLYKFDDIYNIFYNLNVVRTVPVNEGWKLKRHKLKKERTIRKLTIKELSFELGVSETTIKKIENGDRNPSIELAGKIAVFFNTTVEELFPEFFEVWVN